RMPLLFVSLFYKGPFVSGPIRRVDSLPRQLLTGGYEAAVGASLAGEGFLGEEKRIRLQAGSYRGSESRGGASRKLPPPSPLRKRGRSSLPAALGWRRSAWFRSPPALRRSGAVAGAAGCFGLRWWSLVPNLVQCLVPGLPSDPPDGACPSI